MAYGESNGLVTDNVLPSNVLTVLPDPWI